MLVLAVPCWAQPRVDDPATAVMQLLETQRPAFRQTSLQDVAQARAAASAAAREVERVLAAWGDNGRAWQQYLQWDQLAAQLAVDDLELATLESLLVGLAGSHEGLERVEFLRLRAALSRCYYRRRALDDTELESEYDRRMDTLLSLVSSLQSDYSSDTLQRISEQLEWLVRREQAPDVVSALRQLAPAANVWLSVTQDFIAETTREPLDRVDPMTDNILGTTVHGTSHLVGTMAAFPVTAQHAAVLEARLEGAADTTGLGYNGPVRARLVGTAAVAAAGQIHFGPEGFTVGDTTAQVRATGRPTQMWTTYKSRVANGLVTCLARRCANKTQQLGDCIASRHAEDRLEQQLSEELQQRVDRLQEGYLTRFRNPLLRSQTFPRVFEAATAAGGAKVEMLLANPVQPGAWTRPPAADYEAPLMAWIHETALNNLAENLLAGRRVSEVELQQFMGTLLGETTGVAPAARDALDLVLAPSRPITFRLQDSLVEIRIRAEQFIRGRTRYPAMHMILRYEVARDGAQLVATQAQEPEVVPQDFEDSGSRRLARAKLPPAD